VLVDNVVVRGTLPTEADLRIRKSGPAGAQMGTQVTYTLVAENLGTDAVRNTARQVAVTDAIPAGTTFVSSTAPNGWVCSTPTAGGGGTFACSRTSMAPGDTATFTITVLTGCSAGGAFVDNTALIGSATSDPDSTNNVSTWRTTIAQQPPCAINQQLSGAGFIAPELPAYRASLQVNATGPTNPAGTLTFYYGRTRLNFIASATTAVSVNGSVVTLTGTGAVNGNAGHTFSAVIDTAAPQKFGIDIRNAGGAVVYSAPLQQMVGGSVTLQ
jgi:uncharacterized repeat protein (TIGR01451 family)